MYNITVKIFLGCDLPQERRNIMTHKEFYQAIVNEQNIALEMREFAEAQLVKMENERTKRREKPSKTALENAPLAAKIKAEILTAEPMTAKEVGAALGVSTPKATALLKMLEGIEVAETKVGRNVVKTYCLASA